LLVFLGGRNNDLSGQAIGVDDPVEFELGRLAYAALEPGEWYIVGIDSWGDDEAAFWTELQAVFGDVSTHYLPGRDGSLVAHRGAYFVNDFEEAT
jgi:hypothetical protein